MKETYKEALIAEATAQIQDTYDGLDKDTVMEEISDILEAKLEEEPGEEDWGDFEEDVDFLVECWEEEFINEESYREAQEEEKKSQEEVIQEAVDNLHTGFNFIPGIGFGYCKDEEDLAKMREFVRGGMTVVQMMGAMMGL